jgi:hypothetical protein
MCDACSATEMARAEQGRLIATRRWELYRYVGIGKTTGRSEHTAPKEKQCKNANGSRPRLPTVHSPKENLCSGFGRNESLLLLMASLSDAIALVSVFKN